MGDDRDMSHYLSPATFEQWKIVSYAVWQLETAPLTGAIHFQGYVELSSPTALSTIQRKLGRGVHVERSIAGRSSNRAYCTKEETRRAGPWEFDRNPDVHSGGGQGARNDLRAYLDRIKAGATDPELIDEFPELWFRNSRFASQVRSAFRKRRAVKPDVVVLFGAAGSGKSRYAHEQAPDAYRKLPGKWWDGYAGQPDVILDDFYGEDDFKYAEWLKLTDWYDYSAEIKGGVVAVNPTRIFITSNQHPREWFAAVPAYTQAAFFRRITRIVRFDEDGSQEEIDPQTFVRDVRRGGA